MKYVRTGSIRVVAAAMAALALVATTGTTANAAAVTYTKYTKVAIIEQPSKEFSAMQGFAAGSTYLYSIRIDKTDTNSMIYRTNKDTGVASVMQNVQNSTAITTNPWLGHANDIALANYTDNEGFDGHMFVLTLKTTGAQLVKLGYTGNTYKRLASYNILGPDNQILAASGISRVSIDGSNVNLLFKKGSQVYTGSIGLNAAGGADIKLAEAYKLDFSHAYINGVDTDLSGWTVQGFFQYDAGKDVIYASVLQGTTGIVLAFRDVSVGAATVVRQSATDLSFKFTPASASDYRDYTLHEIEGYAVSEGRLYFSTNRTTNSSGVPSPWDSVNVVDGYTA